MLRHGRVPGATTRPRVLWPLFVAAGVSQHHPKAVIKNGRPHPGNPTTRPSRVLIPGSCPTAYARFDLARELEVSVLPVVGVEHKSESVRPASGGTNAVLGSEPESGVLHGRW